MSDTPTLETVTPDQPVTETPSTESLLPSATKEEALAMLDGIVESSDSLELEDSPSEDTELEASPEDTEEQEEPVEQEEPASIDTKTKLLAKVRKFESENVQLKQQIASVQQQVEAYSGQLAEGLKQHALEKPVDFINAFYTPEQAVDLAMHIIQNVPYTGSVDDIPNNGTMNPEYERKLTELEKKIAAQEAREAQLAEQQALSKREQQLTTIFSNIDAAINEQNTPLVHKYRDSVALFPQGPHNQTLEIIQYIYKESGQIPTYEQAAKVLEQIVEEELTKLGAPVVKQPFSQQPARTSSPTLHQSGSSSNPSREKTMEELREEAIRTI